MTKDQRDKDFENTSKSHPSDVEGDTVLAKDFHGAKKAKKKKNDNTNMITKRARSGNPAIRGGVVREIKEAPDTLEARAKRYGKYGLNPPWLVPTMVGLMMVGIVWVVIFYLTASIGGYPIPVLRYINLAVGFGFIIIAFGLSTRWK